MKRVNKILMVLATMVATSTLAFVCPPSLVAPGDASNVRLTLETTTTFVSMQQRGAMMIPASLRRQRRSVASVQAMGLFGLGAPEIVIILIAAAFVIGPQGLAGIAKESGKMAGGIKDELKDVPVEFQKGLDEGESNARARKAKQMDPIPSEIKAADEE